MPNLTPMQSSIYFEQELGGIDANIGGYLRIPCRVEPALFAEAFRILVRTNDALRLCFRSEDGVPLQWIDDESTLSLQYVDLSKHLDPEVAAEEWMQTRFVAPFPDYRCGLFEGALVKARESLYFYHAKGNHLVIDGLSYALMGQRLIWLYERLEAGDRDCAEISYPSVLTFLAQEEDYISSARYQKDRTYWLEQHQGAFRPLFGEMDRPRPVAPTAAARVSLCIDAATYGRIEQLGRTCESGTASVFVALLFTYFSRLFNRDDIVLGLPVHNRGTAKMREVLGPLVNVNAAKLSYEDDLPFVDLARKIASDRRRDYRHQRYPISHLGRELGVHGEGRRRPFEIGFSFEPSDFDLRMDGGSIAAIHRSNGVQQVPLNFTLCDYGRVKDIWLHLDYQTSVVQESAARGHLERLESLIREVLRDPSQVIGSYSILGRHDRDIVREERQRSVREFEDRLCVDELFEKQASLTPQRIAVEEVGSSSLSYEQLNRAANRLAHYLRQSGVESGARIGIYLNRSAEMIIAVLGIMKAGAVYVPFDTHWPVERCRFILGDAGVELILTTSSLLEVWPLEGVDFLLLDNAATDPAWLGEYSNQQIPKESVGVGPNDPAYVLYTSGSTGRPKGAVINQRGFVNYLSHAVRNYMRPEIVGSVVSSPLSFDATITTLFTPLLTGARVTLLPEGDNALVLSALGEYLFDPSASRLFKVTPAHLDAVAGQAKEPNPGSRHVVVVGGEQLTARTLAPWRGQLLSGSTFVNEYGPTETVVGCSVYELRPEDDVTESREGAISIGQAIQNTQLYVMNPRASAVCEAALQPIGATGELYIGGVGVARGYLNREDLSAQRFVPDPFSEVPGARLYRTGDLVRRRADGELEFLGRTDHQIKLRGQRIELGEIEARLRDVPMVRDAVVIDRCDARGARYLAAYVAPEASVALDESALVTECRSQLQKYLPDYMVPAAIVCLHELPLTTNGKLARNALPNPDSDDFSRAAYVAPRNEREAQLCLLWSEALGIERVGPHDNFFNLGGHSLKATRLVSLIRDRLGVELPLTAVFEHPTVARLASEFARVLSTSVLEGLSEASFAASPSADEFEEGEL